MKRFFSVLIILVMFTCSSAHAQVLNPYPHLRKELEALGFRLEEETYQEAIQSYNQYISQMSELGFSTDFYQSKEYFAYTVLMILGMGTYQEDDWTWFPSSDQIYVFDAEFFLIETMYTDFLKGVQSIVRDVAFSEISEDLSGMDEYLEGSRSVSFSCNGTPYTLKMKSLGDWINLDAILPFVNGVLTEQGCAERLHVISDVYDQTIFMIYGSNERASTFRRLIGTTESTFVVESDVNNLIESFKTLFDKVF